MENNIYKIKDSVDLFLSNEKYLMAYFMNTRQRKSFKINDKMKHLIENIDGEKNVKELKQIMLDEYKVSGDYVETVLKNMIKHKIITKVTNSEILSNEDLIRYSRQINYFSEFFEGEEDGIKAQKKLMDSTVLIFGVGSVGGNIALELAMAGVGNLILFDYDVVEISDASRHMYYEEVTVGMKKIELLKNKLVKINSKINVQCIDKSMKPDDDIEYLIKQSNFVINTMDEPYIGYTSAKISRICVNNNIAHYIAGGFDAHLSSTGELIIPYVTPCVECYATHFKKTLAGWKPKSHPVKSRSTEIGGLSSLSLFSSSYACIEIIKYLVGLVSMADNYKIRGEFLYHDMSLTYLNVEKNPDCPICGGNDE